ncbi:MAG: hypothetical protein N4A46_10030 [Schleiferiaceae bacterium]|nr:hypothetical protein [Schleiferiaceae bacterium]
MKITLLSCVLLLLFACSSNKHIVTDGYFESNDTTLCDVWLPEQVLVWNQEEPFPFEYENRGDIILRCHTKSGKPANHDKAKESLLNMAMLMAHDNCADVLIEVEYGQNSLTAKAVQTFSPEVLRSSYRSQYRSGFIQYVQEEQVQNEYSEERKQANKQVWTEFGLSMLSLAFSLFIQY